MAKKPDVNIKLELNKCESATLDRLIDVYQNGDQGKALLIKQCLVGGYLLKESGLLDLVAAIANRDDYKNTDSFGRSKLLVNGLRDLFGSTVTIPTVTPPAPTSQLTPEPAPEPAPEPIENKPTKNAFESLNILGSDSLGM